MGIEERLEALEARVAALETPTYDELVARYNNPASLYDRGSPEAFDELAPERRVRRP